jgi:hypothetical protein
MQYFHVEVEVEVEGGGDFSPSGYSEFTSSVTSYCIIISNVGIYTITNIYYMSTNMYKNLMYFHMNQSLLLRLLLLLILLGQIRIWVV